MEALFRPTTRYRDLQLDPDEREDLPGNWTELELLPGLTVESVWATGVTWEDFCLFLQRKLVWMAPDVYVCPRHLSGRDNLRVLGLRGDDGTPTLHVHVRSGTASAAATAICNFSLRLFATSEQHEVYIEGSRNTAPTPISGAGLSIFFQESKSRLQKVALSGMALNEDQCRALVTMSGLDVELIMSFCILADDAAGAFVKCLHSDGGPVTLDWCTIDAHIFSDALTGNTRVTRLLLFISRVVDDAGMAVLFRALANNNGLVDLDLTGLSISGDNWAILCGSLQAHSTLIGLHLCRLFVFSTEQRAQMTRVVAEMMQQNTVLHTINLFPNERDERIYAEMIQPFLETNLYRLSRKRIFRFVDLCLVARCKPSLSVTIPISYEFSCRGIRMLCFD
jgi:hypothetical protein